MPPRRSRRHRRYIREIQRLRRVSRVQREYLAIVSHELRTPIAAILGGMELLRCEEAHCGQQAVALDVIETSTAHLSDLVGDVRQLSSAEAASMQLRLQPVSIARVCSESVKLVSALARSKQIALDLEIEASLRNVRADPLRLRQILGNLLNNAVKFTPCSGRIGLHVKRAQGGTAAVFEVWDSGPGLSAAQVARLTAFHPFTRLPSSGPAPEGAGLGLSIVKRLVDLHSGKLSIQSAPGVGSRFRVQMPLAPPHAAPDVHAATRADEDESTTGRPQSAAVSPGIRVLFVDDVAANVTIASTYLRQAGFDVTIADGVQRALDILRDTTIDVIVCDVRMHGMDGVELTRLVRNDAMLADLPIIALTGSDRPADRRRCLAAGMNDFLSKPVSLSRLARTISRHAPRRPDNDGSDSRVPSLAGVGWTRELPAERSTGVVQVLHDINDALGAVIGNLDLALQPAESCYETMLRDALDSCLRATDLLKRLRNTIQTAEFD